MDTQALGRYLRETREARELTLDDAQQTLRIRRGILEAFEQGDFSTAGSPVQVRGLLRNYARYLGLDEDRTLQFYDAALNGAPKRRWGRKVNTEELAPVAAKRITDTPPSLPAVPMTLSDKRARRSRGWAGSFITGVFGLAALGVIIFVVWNMLNNMPTDADAATATPAEVGVLAPSETYTATWVPRTAEPAGTMTPLPMPVQVGGGITVMVEFTQRSFLLLTADGEARYDGIAAPGFFQQVEDADVVEITAANAAGLKLTVNGRSEANFGERGSEVKLRITTAGVEIIQQSPTATPVVTIETPVVATPTEVVLPASEIPATSAASVPSLTPFPVPGAATESAAESALAPATAADVPVSDTAPLPTIAPSDTPPPEPSATPVVPTLTPLPVLLTSTPVPTLTAIVSPLPAATLTPLPITAQAVSTATIAATGTSVPAQTATATATATNAPNATATAVLPLRVTQSGLPPTKEGR